MAKLININKTIMFELKPLSNKTQIQYEEDFKNWIGFSMQVKSSTEFIVYSEKDGMMLSVSEVKNLLNEMKKIDDSVAVITGSEVDKFNELLTSIP